jgi:hypothetical protein
MAQIRTPSETTDVDKGVNDAGTVDVEQGAVSEAHLMNTTIRNFTWHDVTVTVKDRQTKTPKNIVENAFGVVEAGAYCSNAL